ncbi:TetR/AcrR family transcriptional regulator [Actinoplanes sp. TRM 88003]|uniref:TetR/AcrR family transcriptional regulator n=1 Tax=Paractinoplanes aksuensis TaxID=2939490 RepID=A0ABT1DL92_9ACTN|nr:TetR/AcrR family transcriptional regulator [Actinoplanes aksuensis]MCO8270831.1 TetR/AcrR family transcriptional regulator [Actinoplanes aksuensis]
MPTGVALRDVRQQLFDAAQRVLLNEGPGALTSRAVTAEAGCAKGVLHRHFADFDDFLAELVRRRIAGFQAWGATMCETAGSGAVDENIADVLALVFDRVGLGLTALILSRDDLRARLGPNGVPMLTEATAVLAAYLTAEQAQHRVPADADVGPQALALVGAAHLALAGTGVVAGQDEIRRLVASILS